MASPLLTIVGSSIALFGFARLLTEAMSLRKQVKRGLKAAEAIGDRQRALGIVSSVIEGDRQMGQSHSCQEVEKLAASALNADRQIGRACHLIYSKNASDVTVAADILCGIGADDASELLEAVAYEWTRDASVQDYLWQSASRLRELVQEEAELPLQGSEECQPEYPKSNARGAGSNPG